MSDHPQPPESDPMTIDPANLGSVDPLSVEGIFLVALGKKGPERDAFLATSCSDAEQRQRVEGLLSAYESAGSFLEKPAVSPEPTPVGQYLAPCEVPGAIGKLGPYEILEEIGRGGMGVVFRAHDPKLQRIVAVKALAPELARLPSARQRFLREARAAAAISHPHVVTIFAVDGTEEASLGTERTTLPYLVMECIVGQTLHDKIKRVGALKTEEIVRISRQIAEGLTAAHKRGLIHRDIKPANILLENGVERVKITDFGLARTVSDGGITHTGEILGTPQCMSPEQARGEVVDQRSDLFSLGCVMYTMCTGVSPFRADNMLAVMKKVCESEPRPVAQLNPNVPEWLCGLVHQLLEKEPERRVQTAGEVVEVLESRAIAIGAHAATSPTKRRADESSQAAQGDIPKWLLTPVIPGLEQWLFKDSLLPVTLIAMLIGFFFGENKESRILMLPLAGILGFGLLSLAKVLLKAPWNWINWKSLISVPLGMFLGGVCRVWLIVRSRSGASWTEELARNNAGWFVLPLAIGVFWLLNRYFRDLFIQSPRSASETQSTPQQPLHWSTWVVIVLTVLTVGMLAFGDSRFSSSLIETVLVVYAVALNVWMFVHLVAWGVKLARSRDSASAPPVAFAADAAAAPMTRQPRSPWSILGWILVSILGVGVFGALFLAIGLFLPYLAMKSAPIQNATYVIRTPEAENLKYVSIDGEQAILQPGGPGEWRIATTPGTHSIYVSFSSDSTLNQERFFTTTATVEQGRTTVIAAEPAMVRSLLRTPGVEAPTPQPTDKPLEPVVLPSNQTSMVIPLNPTISAGVPAGSIPLADAVEVLTDPKTMPAPAMGMVLGGLGTHQEEMTQAVWIDEPGLLIRMKRQGFEGEDGAENEYSSKVAWGTGPFMAMSNVGEVPYHFPAGRYRVLVQDLDFGWPLDRRGTITIGNGPMYVHVKRSFQAHRKLSSGSDQFPLAFRWAGKTYQIATPDEVNMVNMLLTTLDPQSKATAFVPDSFRTHPLFLEAIQIDPQGGGHSLKRERTLAQLDVQSKGMQGGFMSPAGRISWSGPTLSPKFFVPRQELRSVIRDESFSWDYPPVYDNQPIDSQVDLSSPKIIRRDREWIRRKVETGPAESAAINVSFFWFGDSADVRKTSVPVVHKLITSWATGQPDVAEADLLKLAGVATIEELWRAPAAPAVTPAGAASVNSTTPWAIVIPGKEPGTWRIKEPPEGAVVP